MSSNLSTLPATVTSGEVSLGGVLAALAVLAVVQIALAVIALLDLYRRPTSQVVFANKWIWVAVILLVNVIGAIIYLVAGRRPAALEDAEPSGRPSVRTDGIADRLYGPLDGTDRR